MQILKKPNSEAKADALIVHALPGRIRFRLPDKKQDVAYFEQLLTALSGISGVNKLTINPRTASVFIQYDVGATDELNHFLEDNDFFALRKNPSGEDDPVGKAEHRGVAQILADTAGMVTSDIPPTQLVAFGLAGWSCYKLLRGEWKSPEWYVALWYAYNLYRESEAKMEASRVSS